MCRLAGHRSNSDLDPTWKAFPLFLAISNDIHSTDPTTTYSIPRSSNCGACDFSREPAIVAASSYLSHAYTGLLLLHLRPPYGVYILQTMATPDPSPASPLNHPNLPSLLPPNLTTALSPLAPLNSDDPPGPIRGVEA